MTNVWFTSDTHLGHANIIKYCKRPFANVAEMNEAIISRWNERVKKGDLVYHLGDFAFCREVTDLITFSKRLNGQKHLVAGNHDRFVKQKRDDNYGFVTIQPYKKVSVGDQKIVLCHYPFKTWDGSHRGSWNLHGHSHGTMPRDFTAKQIDVGVDVWGFAPISFEEVSHEMERSVFKAVDHHDL